MVVLSPNFTILASMSVVAVMTMLPTADAVAINKSGNSASVQPGHGLNGGTSTSPDVKGPDAVPVGASSPGDITDGVTSIPLPSTRRRSEDNGVGAHRLAERYWTHDQKLNAVSKWWLNGNSPERRASHNGGDVQHENVHVHRRSPSPEPHRHNDDKIIVGGNDDHVRTRRSPSPEPRRHHHHDDDHHTHDKVIVSGNHDHVNMRRAPRSKYRHHFHGHRRSILSSRVPKETFTSLNEDGLVIVSTGKRDGGKANEKRQETAFSEPEGVPGRIDVMSTVAGFSEGQLIASLVVDLVQGNSTNSSSSPQLVLDASQTDQTEVYLVALSDCTGSSSSGSANSTGPADPSDSSPSSSSITSFNFDSPSTAPSNSSTSSCSASSTHKKVALKIPVFNPQNASMTAYCATFNPQPLSPSPLTVESCAAGAITTELRSQVFDYDTLTGVIRPLWYEDVPTDDDGSADGTDAPAGNSTATDVGSSSDTVDTMARIADLSSKLVARSSYSDAQNVTLVFTPASVIIAPPDSSSSSSTVSSTASASSIVSTYTTASDYEYTTTFATFSPAAAPTSSSSDTVVSSDFASTTVVFSPAAATPIFATPSTMSASSTLLASATTSSTSATHSLGVEVFDPDAMPTSASDSSSGSAATSTPSDPTMTPVSTASAPYEWMFREGSVKNKRS